MRTRRLRLVALLAWTPLFLPSLLLAQERRIVPADSAVVVQRRLALVVGNQTYRTNPLTNPRNDAAAVAAALRRLGFDDVTEKYDLTRRQLDDVTREFAERVRAGDLALFYYSGHGVQVSQENYLVPIDFQAGSPADVRYNAFPVAQVRDRLEESGARLRVVILDACRDNPFRGTRSSAGGLTAMNVQGEGTLIAYATAENSTAEDNAADSNGLYTKYLLQALATPGVTLKQVFERTRDAVWLQGGRRQRPFVYDGIVGDLVLTSVPAAVSTAPASGAVPDPEVVAWQAVANTTKVAMLEQFVAAFPNGQYAAAARLKIAALAESAAAETAARVKASELLANGKAANDRRDYAGALRLYLEAAQAGSTRAMVSAGALYENPNLAAGVPRDYGQAVFWYRKAAEAGDADGMNRLAWMYRAGQGVAKDDAQSVFWDGKAAAGGNVRAMSMMGWRYKDGVGVERDAAQATFWYRKAAEAGDGDAMLTVAEAYLSGRGVQRDYGQAMAWYRKVAEAHEREYGRGEAMTALGRMYARGAGVAQDDKEAASWFRKAAEAGNTDAMLQLGEMCEEGRGAPSDLQQAVAWYRKGADRGNGYAMEQLERMYEEGRGVPKDPKQAAAWHDKAGTTYVPQYRQTIKRLRPADDIFRYGKAADGRRDYTEALALYRKAAEAGNAGAMAGLGGMYAMGHGVARDDAQAVAWFQKAAAVGDDEGMEQLGEMYEQGRGLPRDLEQALTWYRKAAAAGNEKAGEGLLRLGGT